MGKLMGAVLAGGILLLLPGCESSESLPYPPPKPSSWVLTDIHAGQEVKVYANARYGAAIYSVTWGGYQFIDSTDHGRELQSAWQLNGHGEAENPTEAGSEADAAGPSSSTIINSVSVAGKVLTSSVKPAYWLTFNGQKTSPHTLAKTVTLKRNVIRHDYIMTLVGNHQNMAVEGITAYTPQQFTRAFTIENGVRRELPKISGMVHLSNNNVILATQDASKAIGCKHTNPAHQAPYGWIGPWPKIDCAWFFVANAVAGSYTWTVFTVVGTLDQVTALLSGSLS